MVLVGKAAYTYQCSNWYCAANYDIAHQPHKSAIFYKLFDSGIVGFKLDSLFISEEVKPSQI